MGVSQWFRTLLLGAGLIPSLLCAQTEPADPLALLKQQDQERAVNATQAAEMAAGLQRKLLGEMHGTNGAGPKAAEAPALAETLTEERVRTAMTAGAEYLLKRLSADGAFRGVSSAEQRPWAGFAGDQQVGVVSLAVYALIETGNVTGNPRFGPNSPQMRPLVNWLINARTHQTYSAALQACALSALPQGKDARIALNQIRDQLLTGMRSDGVFTYSLSETPHFWDNSNTQYAMLGMWAGAEAGVDVPARFWQVSDAHWRSTQAASGGWAYISPANAIPSGGGDDTPTPALTAAGVASLFVALDQRKDDAGARDDSAIMHGLAAVRADFRNSLPVLGDDLYYTFALQRVAVAAGLKQIEGIDWYRRAAASIVLSQRSDGAWTYAYSQLAGTSYALLVLAHGGFPVMFERLEFPGDSSSHARDVAHLARHIGQLVEHPLNWQVADLEGNPEDWLDAPVLLITGRGDPQFDAEQLEKLRSFVHAGGLIFSVALDDDPAFSQAMEQDAILVAGQQYAGRTLPSDHPLFTLEEKASDPPALWGVSNGVRELWVHCPKDLAAAWRAMDYSKKNVWSVPLNMYVYATGKNPPRNRLNGLAITEGARASAAGASLKLARLRYKGNWDPEPGAWPRMAKIMSARTDFLLEVKTEDVETLDAHGTPVVHMTGTEHFVLNDAARRRLAAYLAEGGTLIADAAGGSEEFSASFLDLAKSLAPAVEREQLPADHLIFNGVMKDSVLLDRDRTEFRKSTPIARRISGRPELWGWKINFPSGEKAEAPRYAILFSPLDFTSGLLGSESWGISGYSPNTSQALARDILLYVANLNSAAVAPSH